MFQKVQPLTTSSHQHSELTRAVTYCLAQDMLPQSTVEKTKFKAMLQCFYLQYQLPSHSYFNRVAIPAIVGEVSVKQRGKYGVESSPFLWYDRSLDVNCWRSQLNLHLPLHHFSVGDAIFLLPDTLHTSRPHRGK